MEPITIWFDVLKDKFLVDDGCWLWTGGVTTRTKRHAYGAVRHPVDKRSCLAHRVVYELIVGPIPDGLVLDHLCRNTRCVRPDHLEAVPQAVNVQRGDFSGRRWVSCRYGHDRSANAYWNGRNYVCRPCHRRWAAERRAHLRSEV